MTLLNILSWNWSLVLWLTGGVLIGLHLRSTHYKITAKTLLFTGGVFLTLCALAMPMGPTPHQPLFSMHMAQHILLLMVAPPFLVAGLPEEAVRNVFSNSAMRRAASIFLNLFVAWPLGVGIMWFWHAPVIFNGMVTYSGPGWIYFIIHASEVVSLLGIGVLFCSPILFPLKEYRLPPLKGVMYLFSACISCSILGILITFASPGLYHTVFSSGTAIAWGLTERIDQQLGGLLMWVPGCFIYLSGVIILLIRWFSEPKSTATSTSEKTITAHY